MRGMASYYHSSAVKKKSSGSMQHSPKRARQKARAVAACVFIDGMAMAKRGEKWQHASAAA